MISFEKILCNGFAGKTGIHNPNPVFSWQLSSDESDIRQEGYRIEVAKDARSLDNGNHMWDSRRIKSVCSHGIAYEGASLESRSRYYFRVTVFFEGGRKPLESPVQTFTTALFDDREWTADWIGGGGLLRKSFKLESLPGEALAFVTGLGYYELYVNGKRAGNRGLLPSVTDYKKRIEYQCVDLKPLLRKGENVIGIMLGAHWKQKPDGSRAQCYQDVYYRGPLKARFQMRLDYPDGKHEDITSGTDWKCASGPIVYSSIYDGEWYDASLEQPGWDSPGFKDSGWDGVTRIPDVGAVMSPEILPPIRDTKKMAPVSITKLPDGDFVVDFGVNISGVAQIAVENQKGKPVLMRFAEVVYPDGSIDQRNLRWAEAKDTYVPDTNERRVYRPRFTYHGFRYAQVSGYEGELTKRDITAFHFHSDVEPAGRFKCSDARLNKVHSMMQMSLINNLQSMPLDCHQRDERQAWMGDAQVVVYANMANYDMQWFYRKWLLDIADMQAEDGNLYSMTAPAWLNIEGLSYSCAYYVVVWCLYRYYDDIGAVKEHFDNLERFFAYLTTREDGQGLLTLTGLNDWLGTEPTDEKHIRDALWYEFAFVMAEMAKAIGKKERAKYYANKAKNIKDAYNNAYYGMRGHTHKDSGYYGDCYYMGQLNNAMPICMGMVEPEYQKEVEEALRYELTEARGQTVMTTGLIGTRYLFDALIRLRYDEIAYQLFKRNDYPSYGFMIKHGATSVWERWQYRTCNEMNSHCHPGLAAPDVWFYEIAAGISGYEKDKDGRIVFTLAPWFDGKLKSVSASRHTPWGTVSVSWKKEAGRVKVDIQVPVNTSARFRGKILFSGNHSVECDA